MTKLLRLLAFNKITRMALMIFLWNRRNDVRRWGESLWNELRGSRVDPQRLKRLSSVLLAIARDPKLSAASELRSVRLVGDTVQVDMEPNWPYASRLANTLSGVKGIAAVQSMDGTALRTAS